jgi:hypothetical protein
MKRHVETLWLISIAAGKMGNKHVTVILNVKREFLWVQFLVFKSSFTYATCGGEGVLSVKIKFYSEEGTKYL